MEYDVVSLGDLVADLLLPIPELPIRQNEHQMARGLFVEPGGAGNFLIAASRMGLKAVATGCVGDDIYGKHIVRQLMHEGVDASDVDLLLQKQTTLALVLVDDAGEHVFLGVLGTARMTTLRASWERRTAQAKAFYTNGYAFLEATPPTLILEMIRTAKAKGALVFFDPGPQIPGIEPHLMNSAVAETDVLLLTLEEAVKLTDKKPPEHVARELLSQGPRLVVLKMGAKGCLVSTEDRILNLNAFPITRRDTTGAGDAFDAACVYGVLKGLSLEQIGTLANAVGGATTTKLGAGTRLPSWEEVLELLKTSSVCLSLDDWRHEHDARD